MGSDWLQVDSLELKSGTSKLVQKDNHSLVNPSQDLLLKISQVTIKQLKLIVETLQNNVQFNSLNKIFKL